MRGPLSVVRVASSNAVANRDTGSFQGEDGRVSRQSASANQLKRIETRVLLVFGTIL